MNEVNKNEHPNGTYVSVTLSKDSQNKLNDWVTANGIENPAEPSQYHTTVIYSRAGVPDVKHYDLKLPVQASIKEWKKFDTKAGPSCLVAIMDADNIVKYHDDMINQYGATHDYPEYHPHITVSYDYPSDVPATVPDLTLDYDDKEIKPLDLDFVPPTKK